MKKLCFVLLATCMLQVAHAQLVKTKWTGVLIIDNDKKNVILDFKKDSLVVFDTDAHSRIETMLCSIKPGAFTIIKVAGNSDCDQTKAVYKYTIKGNQLSIAKLEDNCADRYNVIDNKTFTKL